MSIPGEHLKIEDAKLRDWFAGQALTGLLACGAVYGGYKDNWAALANDAYATADAMLKARTNATHQRYYGDKE